MNANEKTIGLVTIILFLSLSCQKEIVQREPVGFNYALVLDGVTTHITIPRIAIYQLTTFTVEALALFDELHDGLLPIIAETGRNQWNRADGFGVIYERRQIVLRLAKGPREAVWIAYPFHIQPGKWYHILCSFDGRTARIFVDGQLAHEEHNEFPVYYGDAGFSIGHALNSLHGGEVFFKGQIDEVRIWNHVRSESQVLKYSRASLKGDEYGLVGYWNFDDHNNNLEPAMDHSMVRNHGHIAGRIRLVQSTAFSTE